MGGYHGLFGMMMVMMMERMWMWRMVRWGRGRQMMVRD